MQARWNSLQIGLLLGLVSLRWHLGPLLLMHRSPTWIAWWCLYAVAARILIVWLYNNTGKSVLAAHAAPRRHLRVRPNRACFYIR